MHLQGSPLCLPFVRCDRTLISQSCEGRHVNVTFADTVVACIKRPKALRSEIVNDVLNDLSPAADSGASSLQFESENDSEKDDNHNASFDDSDDIRMLMFTPAVFKEEI
jgi:hypothetical protein